MDARDLGRRLARSADAREELRVPSTWTALAFQVLNGGEQDARVAAVTLARLVIDTRAR